MFVIFGEIKMCDKKKKFDKEYATSYVKEKQFLDSYGIRYSFIKTINGITIFKYTKTQELFHALSVFYKNMEFTNEQFMIKTEA